jgi:hypothetical protein
MAIHSNPFRFRRLIHHWHCHDPTSELVKHLSLKLALCKLEFLHVPETVDLLPLSPLLPSFLNKKTTCPISTTV